MAARKASTIGSNPLDQVVPLRRAELPEPAPEPAKAARERVTIALSAELMERARNAVWWNRGTLAGLVEDAVAEALERLERENGGPFKARSEALKPGRRVSA